MAQKGDLMTARSDIRVLDATIRDGGTCKQLYVLRRFYQCTVPYQRKGRR